MVRSLLVCLGVFGASPTENAMAPANLADYAEAKARFGPGADDQVRLALWCEAHGLPAERERHLARAVLNDPKNARARALMGLVDDGKGHWRRPEAVADSLREREAATLAEYNARRETMADTADGHWRLALWCEKNGLKPEAVAHLTTVTRLDPTRKAAWTHLGFKQYQGRWASAEAIAAEKAEAEAQTKANAVWKRRLERLKGFLAYRDKNRKAHAEDALVEVSDPRAVPALMRVFGASDPTGGRWTVQLLGRIEGAASSRALADIAAGSPSDDVRRAAAETLRRRDPREFIERLIGRLTEPVKYHVREVVVPGQSGELLVEGRNANVSRVYTTPQLPNVPVTPGSTLERDADGALVLVLASLVPGADVFSSMRPALSLLANRAGADATQVIASELGPNAGLSLVPFRTRGDGSSVGSPDGSVRPRTAVPIGKMVEEIDRAAYESRAQMREDVRFLEHRNAEVRKANDPLVLTLEAALGWSAGPKRSDWENWWNDQKGYVLASNSTAVKQTVTMQIQPQYNPQPIDRFRFDPATGYYLPNLDCFAAGTPVRTFDGPKAIETIKVGDRVLAQDAATGALSYQPVVAVCHNPPAEVLKVALGEETVLTTRIQRFWKANTGWVMARDLKPGDSVRTVGGSVVVGPIETGDTRPVFNLEVAGGHDFFAGSLGLLVHDHTVPDAVPAPFDAPPVVASATSNR